MRAANSRVDTGIYAKRRFQNIAQNGIINGKMIQKFFLFVCTRQCYKNVGLMSDSTATDKNDKSVSAMGDLV